MAKVTTEIGLDLTKDLKGLISAVELQQEAHQVIKIIRLNTCRDSIIERKFEKQFGFDKRDLLPAICQYFYERGLEDAKDNMIEKIKE